MREPSGERKASVSLAGKLSSVTTTPGLERLSVLLRVGRVVAFTLAVGPVVLELEVAESWVVEAGTTTGEVAVGLELDLTGWVATVAVRSPQAANKRLEHKARTSGQVLKPFIRFIFILSRPLA